MRQDKRRPRPLADDGLQVAPQRVLRLLRLRPMLLIQEAALGNHHGDALLQPRRLLSQRPRRGVAHKGKDGRRVRRRELLAGLALGLQLGARQSGELGLEALRGLAEDVAQAGHLVMAAKGRGGDARGAPQRHRVAGPQRVRPMRPEKGRGRRRPAELLAARNNGGVQGQATRLGVLGANLAAAVQHRLGQHKVVQRGAHLGRAEDVRRVVALDKGRRQQRVVAVAVRQEDVLGALVVDHQAGVQQQVERRDHKRRVPGGAGPAGQHQLAVRLGESPFEDAGPRGLRQGGGEPRRGRAGHGMDWMQRDALFVA